MTGAETTTMQEPEQPAAVYTVRLPSPSIFDGLDADARATLEGEVEWFCLPGGQTLFAKGEPPDALYLLLSGALGLIAAKPGSSGAMIAQIHAGETVGEMGVLSNRPRSATAVALRDSSLLRIGKPVFEKLLRLHPDATLRLLAQLVDWLDHTMRGTSALFVPKTLALIPLDAAVPTEDLAARLAASLLAMGLRVEVLGETAVRRGEEYFHAVESARDLIIYRGAVNNTAWMSQCVRRADRLLFLSATGESPPADLRVLDALPPLPWRVSELVLLHQESGVRRPAAPWLARLPVQGHYHLRCHSQADIARLARCVTGRAIGLVLSGGGARGFGHIGVIKALREAGLPLDLLGGTSIGSIIAAGAALEWTDTEFETHMRRAFVDFEPAQRLRRPARCSDARSQGHDAAARAFWREPYRGSLAPVFLCGGESDDGQRSGAAPRAALARAQSQHCHSRSATAVDRGGRRAVRRRRAQQFAGRHHGDGAARSGDRRRHDAVPGAD